MRDWHELIRARLSGSGMSGEQEAAVIEELAQQLEDRYDELRSRGAEDEETTRLVLSELDEEGVLGRRLRHAMQPRRAEPVPVGKAQRGRWVADFLADLGFGARLLRRSPGFTTVAALVIALGIGATTVVYGLVSAVLLRPPPGVEASEELVAIYTSDYSGPRFGGSSYPDYEAIAGATEVFRGVAAQSARTFTMLAGEQSEAVFGELVSTNYFDLLGVSPRLGRFFSASEEGTPGSGVVAVISETLWQRQFGGAPDVLGRPIQVSGQTLTIVGVAPEAFRGWLRGPRAEIWMPLTAPDALTGIDLAQRGARVLLLVGRLGAGITPEAAETRLAVLAGQLHAAYPDAWTDLSGASRILTVLPEAESRIPPQMRSPVLGALGMLVGIVTIVLLIVCANVANLMLARGARRQKEIGIRLALGATRTRVIVHLMAESLLLAALGGGLGLLLAMSVPRILQAFQLPNGPAIDLGIAPNPTVVLFAIAMTAATGLIFGLGPALQSTRAPASIIRGTASSRLPRGRLRATLVVVQVAASLVLLIGGGLFLRSLMEAQGVEIGFEPHNVLVVTSASSTDALTDGEAAQYHERAAAIAAAIPGVSGAAVAERVPLGGGFARRSIGVAGYTPGPGEDMEFPFNGVGPGYFEVMGIPLREGREFTPTDDAGAPLVVIVNETFATRFWPGEDPLGKLVSLGGANGPNAEVIGVAPDGKYGSVTEPSTPYYYYPYLQHPERYMMLHVRTAIDPERVTPVLRRELARLEQQSPAPLVETLEQRVESATLPQRIAAVALGALGGLALLIATIGLYGLVAYTVAQRTREFGIRIALGALAPDVRRMVIGDGLRVTAFGVAIGIALALALSWLVRAFLLVSPFDPLAFLVVPLLLMAAAAMASYLPARRATRVDPMVALRSE
jgi:putative ABC transport system permease protein